MSATPHTCTACRKVVAGLLQVCPGCGKFGVMFATPDAIVPAPRRRAIPSFPMGMRPLSHMTQSAHAMQPIQHGPATFFSTRDAAARPPTPPRPFPPEDDEEEESEISRLQQGEIAAVATSRVPSLADRDGPPPQRPRVSTRIPSVDLVLGRNRRDAQTGAVLGKIYLFTGDAGVGKSTLLTQVEAEIAHHEPTLYGCCEEEREDIELRIEDRSLIRTDAARANFFNPFVRSAREFCDAMMDVRPRFAGLDSLSELAKGRSNPLLGLVSDATMIRDTARKIGCAVILLCHMNAELRIGGPKALEHLGDATLLCRHVTRAGEELPEGEERQGWVKFFPWKNRFAPSTVASYFYMTDDGLVPARMVDGFLAVSSSADGSKEVA